MSGIDSTLTRKEWETIVYSLNSCHFWDLADKISERIGHA